MRNINSKKNKIWGTVVGLVKGCVFIIVMVLVLQNIDTVSQKYFWVESDGLLKAFQEIVLSIKPEYLSFTNKD